MFPKRRTKIEGSLGWSRSFNFFTSYIFYVSSNNISVKTEEITGGSFDNEICYTGAVYDRSTGLYYLNARYYNPEIGRFVSQDSYRGSVDKPGQWHLYAYCANNPINYVDPSGHDFLANWVKALLKKVRLSVAEKTSIRIYISGVASAYLNQKGYTLARKMFNHAL